MQLTTVSDIEYFKSCFDSQAEPGIDDMDLAYAYLHCSDTRKFISGFRKFLENNVIVIMNDDGAEMEAIYSVENFLQWIKFDMDTQDKKILEPPTWEEYRIVRMIELDEEASRGRIEPLS